MRATKPVEGDVNVTTRHHGHPLDPLIDHQINNQSTIRLLDQRAGVVIDLCSLSDRLGGLLAYAKRLTRIHATALPYNKGIWYSQGSSQFPSFGYTDDWSTTGYNQFGELDCKSEFELSLRFPWELRMLRSIIGNKNSENRTQQDSCYLREPGDSFAKILCSRPVAHCYTRTTKVVLCISLCAMTDMQPHLQARLTYSHH